MTKYVCSLFILSLNMTIQFKILLYPPKTNVHFEIIKQTFFEHLLKSLVLPLARSSVIDF